MQNLLVPEIVCVKSPLSQQYKRKTWTTNTVRRRRGSNNIAVFVDHIDHVDNDDYNGDYIISGFLTKSCLTKTVVCVFECCNLTQFTLTVKLWKEVQGRKLTRQEMLIFRHNVCLSIQTYLFTIPAIDHRKLTALSISSILFQCISVLRYILCLCISGVHEL